MQRPSDQFLAAAGLAGNQYGGRIRVAQVLLGRNDSLDRVTQARYCIGLANQFLKSTFAGVARPVIRQRVELAAPRHRLLQQQT